LKELYCERNQLTSLPTLPESLKKINCVNNKLTSLPVLPKSLKDLYCDNNQLTSLPVLPKSLKELYCDNNLLTSLPVLQESLEELYCDNNLIKLLPVLPKSLGLLSCYNNQLTSLPKLPKSLKQLDYENNLICDILENLSVNKHVPLIRRLEYLFLDKDVKHVLLIRPALKTLNRFRYLYYCLKFKIKFLQWLLRSKEAQIMKQNHPDKIIKLLESGIDVLDLDKYL